VGCQPVNLVPRDLQDRALAEDLLGLLDMVDTADPPANDEGLPFSFEDLLGGLSEEEGLPGDAEEFPVDPLTAV
jgi:hypothetical protein